MNNTLFGVVGLTLGFLTPNQLSHALYIQEIRKNVKQTHSRLGEISVELGYLSAEQVEFIVERSRVLRMAPYMAPKNPSRAETPSTAEAGEETPAMAIVMEEAPLFRNGNSTTSFKGFDRSDVLELKLKDDDAGESENYRVLKAGYELAAGQVSQLTEEVHALRERELELAIRAETAEFELSEVRQQLQNLQAAMSAQKPKTTLLKVFGRP